MSPSAGRSQGIDTHSAGTVSLAVLRKDADDADFHPCTAEGYLGGPVKRTPAFVRILFTFAWSARAQAEIYRGPNSAKEAQR